MNTTQWTFQFTEEDISFAKEYAQKHRISVEELLSRYFQHLQRGRKESLHDDIEKFSGIVPADVDAERLYKEHVFRKHQ
jgi:molecular chaperone DnaK (HSP70)